MSRSLDIVMAVDVALKNLYGIPKKRGGRKVLAPHVEVSGPEILVIIISSTNL